MLLMMSHSEGIGVVAVQERCDLDNTNHQHLSEKLSKTAFIKPFVNCVCTVGDHLQAAPPHRTVSAFIYRLYESYKK